MTAKHEFVVPRSIPMVFAMSQLPFVRAAKSGLRRLLLKI
jgi:hypothetical protein